MIDIIIGNIIRYITSNIGLESEEIEERANKDLKTLINYYFKDTIHTTTEGSKYFLESIETLKTIRRVYQKGKPFVQNLSKGKRKHDNDRWYRVLLDLSQRDKKEAKEFASKHLQHIKEFKSERTWYRHKKRIKEIIG